MTQAQLSRVSFPWWVSKSEVRAMAEQYGLPVLKSPTARRFASFSKNYSAFVENYIDSREQANSQRKSFQLWALEMRCPQPLCPKMGRVLYVRVKSFCTTALCWESIEAFISSLWGSVGLGVAVGEPLYVIETDAATNRVVVGKSMELMKSVLIAGKLN
jgi:tRNA U34 2-thiouridine synthase MnmA/TrmU